MSHSKQISLSNWLTDPSTGQRLLEQLTPAVRKVSIRAGDVFALKPTPDFFLFGRVIRTDADTSGIAKLNSPPNTRFDPPCDVLVYIHSARSETDAPPIGFSSSELLIPPLMTNQQGWLRGFFHTVGHEEISHTRRHSFFDPFYKREHRYFDDDGNVVPGPIGDVGVYGTDGFDFIAQNIHYALAGALRVAPGSPRIGQGAFVPDAWAKR